MLAIERSDPTCFWIACGSFAEIATFIVATVALILSGLAVAVTRRSEQRQAFIQLHDLLTSAASQEGRRLLYTQLKTADDIERMYRKRPEKFDLVNRTVGLYNTLGVYVHEKYVPRGLALRLWGQAIAGQWRSIEGFLRWRRTTHSETSKWDYLVWLAGEAGADVSPEMALPDGWSGKAP